jgi:hypothetical protein
MFHRRCERRGKREPSAGARAPSRLDATTMSSRLNRTAQWSWAADPTSGNFGYSEMKVKLDF